MALKVEVISKEIIKPSIPTPLHLKTLKLSLLDQYMTADPVHIIIFYPAKNADHENEKGFHHLKKSLSEVLTDFYPLAGRIADNKFIDCNDEGINFTETQVFTLLSHVISHPEADQLLQLLPIDELDPKAILSIQANRFECGGLAISVGVSHKICDASSLSLFLNHWAAVSRGDRKAECPKFDTSSIFPPLDEVFRGSSGNFLPQKLVTKKFVFDARNIAALKAKISNDFNGTVPTRVEAVSAVLWGCAINAAQTRTEFTKSQSLLYVPLNLRGRMVPPLSKFWFGNLALGTLGTTDTKKQPELHFLVGQLQEAIGKFDDNYTTQLQTLDGYLAHADHLDEMHELYHRSELGLHTLISWCRFSFYDADFGWGEPIWATFADFAKNQIVLMDTKCGQGVEAWVTLDEEDMAKFQCEPYLIAFTSNSPMIN